MNFQTKDIRNVSIVGHGGTGKTLLFEQILFNADVISKAEDISSGKTVSDYSTQEIEKGYSIYSSSAHISWKEHKMNFIDTPGSAGFIGEVVGAFRTTESSLMVIDAKDSVQIETLKLWRRLNMREMPRAVFVNKMDEDRASYENVIADLREKFKKNFVPVTIPIGSGADFKGVINLIEKKAYLVHDSSKKDTQSEIPEDMIETVESMRESMIELAAEGADELIEKYFSEGTLSEDDIRLGLTLGMKTTRVVPVLCGSAKLNNGISSFLNFLSIVAPSPRDIIETATDKDGNDVEVHILKEGKVSLMVYKTKIDQFSGKLSYIKVVSGILKSESELLNTTTGKKEKIGKIYTCTGKKLEEVKELAAGDLGILAKVADVETNHTLTDLDYNIHFNQLKLPHPAFSLAISAEAKKDEDKLNDLLHKAAQQDLTFTLRFNAETKETVVSAIDEMHMNLILNKIKNKDKVAFSTKTPRIAYRETITKSCQSEYTHKKQSGGHGQYGKVVIDFEPLPRGQKFEMLNHIKGGAISKGYMPGIEKGLVEGMEQGFLAGYPIVDIRAIIVDGKEHSVDSSEMSFKLAAKGALKDAMGKAGAVLLEPVMLLKVYAEDQYMGDILSDLSAKRGKVLGQEAIGGGISEIDAEVPQGEMQRYAIDLKQLTSGTGSFEIEFSHYNPISGKIAQAVIDEAKVEE